LYSPHKNTSNDLDEIKTDEQLWVDGFLFLAKILLNLYDTDRLTKKTPRGRLFGPDIMKGCDEVS
jgi:hypothetical protein